jgi:hypothetical protein
VRFVLKSCLLHSTGESEAIKVDSRLYSASVTNKRLQQNQSHQPSSSNYPMFAMQGWVFSVASPHRLLTLSNQTPRWLHQSCSPKLQSLLVTSRLKPSSFI